MLYSRCFILLGLRKKAAMMFLINLEKLTLFLGKEHPWKIMKEGSLWYLSPQCTVGGGVVSAVLKSLFND